VSREKGQLFLLPGGYALKKVDMQCCGNCARSSYKEQMYTDEMQLECNLDIGVVDADTVCIKWAFDGKTKTERCIEEAAG